MQRKRLVSRRHTAAPRMYDGATATKHPGYGRGTFVNVYAANRIEGVHPVAAKRIIAGAVRLSASMASLTWALTCAHAPAVRRTTAVVPPITAMGKKVTMTRNDVRSIYL